MKKSKHYLLFLLAGAVLILPVTQHYAYAISWEDIKNKISSFFNQDSLQKIVPGGMIALGVVGGLYYWWTKNKSSDERKSSSEEIEKPKLILEQSEESDVDQFTLRGNLKQIPIYSQNNVGGEGAESSGYHALLRAMQVVKYKGLSREDAFFFETKALEEKEPTVIEVFFGKKQNTQQEENGVWRKEIIDYRVRKDEDSLDGDWLTGEEIIYLWDLSKNDLRFDVLTKFPCMLHVVGKFKKTQSFILNDVKPLLNQKKLFFVIFMLETNDTRWYSLVMYQNQNGNRQYYIMDSDDNIDRTQDDETWEIIELIEEPFHESSDDGGSDDEDFSDESSNDEGGPIGTE